MPIPAKAPPARVVGRGINLRWLQREDADALMHAIETGHNRPCCVGATGVGKGAIIAEVAGRLHRAGGKVVCLVDRAHLVHQLADEIDRHLGVTCGRVADGQAIGIHHPYVVSTVQAMYTPDAGGKPLFEYPQFESTRAVIADEAHKMFAPVFRSPIEHFIEMHGAVCVGFTATPVAANGAEWQSFFNWTPEAEGPCMRTVGWCIRNGYLVPPRQAFVSVNLDLRPLYDRLADTLVASESDDEPDDAAAVLLDLLSDKGEQDAARFAAGVADVIGDRRAIVFAPPRVAAAKLLASWLKAAGMSSDAVWGGRVDKSDVLASFKRGRPQVLSNVNILCEGFDSPTCSAVFICRLMKQWRLVAQMVGRCLRPSPSVIPALSEFDEPEQSERRRAAIAASEKPDALVADLVGIDGKVLQASALDVLYAGESDDVRREAGDIILSRKKGSPQDDVPDEALMDAARSQLLHRQHEQLAEQARRRGMAGDISADVSVTYDDGRAVRVPKAAAPRQSATIGEKAMFVACATQYPIERAMDMAERFPRNQLKGMTFGMKRKLDASNTRPDWSRARKAYPEWAKQKAGAR
jgi:superfamily II DNA or RNA helicase